MVQRRGKRRKEAKEILHTGEEKERVKDNENCMESKQIQENDLRKEEKGKTKCSGQE